MVYKEIPAFAGMTMLYNPAMFFWFSKLFWALAQPLTFLALFFLAGLIFHKYAWGKKLAAFTAIAFIVCGFIPVGPLLIRELEKGVQIPEKLPSRIDGIIVLGGAVNAESSAFRHQPQLNEWSERVFEMMRLSQIYPQARIVYSGGAGNWHGKQVQEAEIIREMLESMKFPTKNFIFEDKSRTTSENVTESKNIVHPQSYQNWLLVTSAFHMPRAKAVFEKQGWNVIPYPAGFIENGPLSPWQFIDVLGNYWKLNVAVKEIIGLIAYRLSGRT